MGEEQKPRSRPVESKTAPVPDTFENVIMALVVPKKDNRYSSNEESEA